MLRKVETASASSKHGTLPSFCMMSGRGGCFFHFYLSHLQAEEKSISIKRTSRSWVGIRKSTAFSWARARAFGEALRRECATPKKKKRQALLAENQLGYVNSSNRLKASPKNKRVKSVLHIHLKGGGRKNSPAVRRFVSRVFVFVPRRFFMLVCVLSTFPPLNFFPVPVRSVASHLGVSSAKVPSLAIIYSIKSEAQNTMIIEIKNDINY